MATFTSTPSNWTNASSDANFRAWATVVSNALTTVGLAKTADTGQIDLVSATNPGATNTYVGYEIRVFADTLQSTAPVYVKVEYGEGNTTDTPSVRFTFGTGSNGSGTLTGTTSTPIAAAASSTASGVTVTGSGANNRFVFTTSHSSAHFFGFERTKDAQGNDTAEGIVFYCSGTASTSTAGPAASSARTLYWNPAVGTQVDTSSSSTMAILFPWQSTFVYGAQTGVCPIFPERPLFGNPILGAVGYYTGDIATGTTFNAYMYGTAHQYFACTTNVVGSGGVRGPGSGSEAIAIRYE